MEQLVVSLAIWAVLVAYATWRYVQNRRHRTFVTRLTDAVRDLGFALGGGEDTPEFETIEAGDLVLKAGEKRIRVPVGDLLDVAGEPDFQRRTERMRWLVEKSRARTEG